jgi:hypothetical protein
VKDDRAKVVQQQVKWQRSIQFDGNADDSIRCCCFLEAETMVKNGLQMFFVLKLSESPENEKRSVLYIWMSKWKCILSGKFSTGLR